ncbi:MAG: hypothetical protein Q4A44_03710 [Bacteroidales bacterium]|nr:hypothetical protein [Bacteroidales bacterium]
MEWFRDLVMLMFLSKPLWIFADSIMLISKHLRNNRLRCVTPWHFYVMHTLFSLGGLAFAFWLYRLFTD